jgi:transcriptional regulator with XRE-family HTH domain
MGYKQSDLAKEIDSTPASISNIENSVQSIQLVDLYKIAALLKKEVSDFLPSLKELENAIPTIEKEKKNYSSKEEEYIDILRKEIRKEE